MQFGIKEMDGTGCSQNCSGHGHCQNGMCICQCICIRNDYQRQRGKKSIRAAMSLTAQKLLYIFTIIATIIRGIYFFTKWHISEVVSLNLWSAYYPIVLSGFAFIICLWAEAFHLENIDHDKPGFLSKSVIGFYVFNIFIYTLLCAQLVATDVSTDTQFSDMIVRISNSLLALMMIIAVVFFLIYGVEVYFKVRGAFREPHTNVDSWQLHSSRIGLLAQAILQLVTALFIVSDVLKELWKDQLPILNQNFYDIGFRLSEFGIALWFPCVLWNCKRPQDLWVLNPRRLFKSFDFHDNRSDSDSDIDTQSIENDYTKYGSIKTSTDVPKLDCWICYDVERQDAGALIQPCQCKGDVATVHHECLRKWLMECAEKEEALKCKVCNKQYKLEDGWVWLPRGLKKRHWFQTFLLTGTMIGAPFGTYALWHSIYVTQTYMNILIIGLTILVELVCLRWVH
ncbi:hypothetical protein KUTeg_022087 [Tegillarca granosa]|uniref:RING-CH-type domain-containing protein n=1 Tax=Tegillarca granosa TaxID=220873 RepID=A0ABQ9EBD6_TEGGR|nr:hypothetical protein KUTeg_022087 [Tegillarca granosa]